MISVKARDLRNGDTICGEDGRERHKLTWLKVCDPPRLCASIGFTSGRRGKSIRFRTGSGDYAVMAEDRDLLVRR